MASCHEMLRVRALDASDRQLTEIDERPTRIDRDVQAPTRVTDRHSNRDLPDCGLHFLRIYAQRIDATIGFQPCHILQIAAEHKMKHRTRRPLCLLGRLSDRHHFSGVVQNRPGRSDETTEEIIDFGMVDGLPGAASCVHGPVGQRSDNALFEDLITRDTTAPENFGQTNDSYLTNNLGGKSPTLFGVESKSRRSIGGNQRLRNKRVTESPVVEAGLASE